MKILERAAFCLLMIPWSILLAIVFVVWFFSMPLGLPIAFILFGEADKYFDIMSFLVYDSLMSKWYYNL